RPWPRSRRAAWGTACAMITASSGRPSRTASRSNTPTTGWPRPTPGKWPGRGKRSGCRSAVPSAWRTASSLPSPATPPNCWACPLTVRWWVTAGRRVTTLRLWGAASPEFFDFGEFSSGDFVGAIVDRVVAETVTRVLYPDDSTVAGQALRFVQEYFLVCCSLADIVARFRRTNSDWKL